MRFLAVQTFWKLVKISQSYRVWRWELFWDTVYYQWSNQNLYWPWINSTLWPPSTPAGPNYCCSRGLASYWSNPQFLISDIRALWCSVLSARVPECQKLKNGGLDQYGRCKALMGSAVKDLRKGSAITLLAQAEQWHCKSTEYCPVKFKKCKTYSTQCDKIHVY